MEVEKVKKRAPSEESGVVVSDKMSKTIVVKLTRRVIHPKYKKYMTKSKRVMVHDDKERARVGDRVLLVETRPQSKRKRYALKKILKEAARV